MWHHVWLVLSLVSVHLCWKEIRLKKHPNKPFSILLLALELKTNKKHSQLLENKSVLGRNLPFISICFDFVAVLICESHITQKTHTHTVQNEPGPPAAAANVQPPL